MRACILLSAVLLFELHAADPHPTGNRTTPPALTSVAPRGVARGTTAELTVEGLNLAGTRAIVFDRAGIKGRVLRVKELPDLSDLRLGANGTPSSIDLGPLPPRNQVTVELDIEPDAEIGTVGFRLLTPLGTTSEGKFLLEPFWGESPDREPNDAAGEAVETFLPAVLTGDIGRPGDVDYFKVKVTAGEELVFENGAASIGSTLQPVIALLREDHSVIKEFGSDGSFSAARFAYRFDKGGTYLIRISDYQQSGRASHSYRIKAGKFAYVTSVFPLGVREGSSAQVNLLGHQLSSGSLPLKGAPSEGESDRLRLRPKGAFSDLVVAVGRDSEVLASQNNISPNAAQPISLPVTINGKLDKPGSDHFYRFKGVKGQRLVLEVLARRFESPLDSEIEVLTADGKPIDTATVRAVLETSVTLRDHDSVSRSIRLSSVTGLAVGDYLMSGNEIMRLREMPPGPDDDTILDNFAGQRIDYFGTSGEAHHIERAVYKVQIHPPGAQFTPNGLPLVRLHARNDDGGPGFGKDSRLEFKAPSDGDYLVRIRDIRGFGGSDFAYRLNVREPRADFKLSVSPRNPNIPVGGVVPITVTALRQDDFDGPIEVLVEGLPAGIQATKGVIQPGQVSTVLLLSAEDRAELEAPVPLTVLGKAEGLARLANPEDHLKVVALMPKPDVMMTSETREISIEPGGTAQVTVTISRQNGFGGRVPVEVRNLPPRVRVLDVGLNGVLINEDETRRVFTIEALESATSVDQDIYVAARVETRSPLESSYAAPQPIRLRVKPRATVANR